ncbi:MAG: hypothetical protein KGV56_05330 [Gammaproteobacteria bacterium]|nr:hypothetical protein [Gammaproteobacteria bacterium]
MKNKIDESNEKWHWYLIHISWQVRVGKKTISGTNEGSVALVKRNISEKILNKMKRIKLEELQNEYGEDENIDYGIQILSLSYLGYMSNSEYYDDEN